MDVAGTKRTSFQVTQNIALSGGCGLRTIIEEIEAQHAAEVFSGEFSRFDEAWEALKWLLCRTPNIGARKMFGSAEFYLYVSAPDELAKTPAIWVVYSYTDHEVTIYDLIALQSNQFDRFVETARALGCDEDKERFEESLGKIARHNPKEESAYGIKKSKAKKAAK